MAFHTNTLASLFYESTSKYSSLIVNRSSDDIKGQTYAHMKKKTLELSEILSQHGIGKGDRVAILSAGHPNWISAFFSITAFGRVAVPLLADFSESIITNVINHSESKAIFVSSKCLARLSEKTLSQLKLVILLDTLEIIHSDNSESVYASVSEPSPEDLAVIIYTSGTTGNAKGVMLTNVNFTSTLTTCYTVFEIGTEDVMLSVLPLAHAYELSLGLLYPFSAGTSVVYLSKAPTPSILAKAFKDIRPTAMLVVPLIIEKIYKGIIIPKIKKSKLLTFLDKYCNYLLCRLVGKALQKQFGGRLKFLGIGGAKLDVTVESFLNKARFPYYIGYGLTECCPLLSIACYKDTIPGSIGRAVEGVELKLYNVNPSTGEGEIIARGMNIMPGYYKDPDRTAESFTDDGWFRTNDLAIVDSEHNYFIKGRLGNMILGASGENIYPEEIEKVIYEMPMVEDAIVVSWAGKLVALVKANEGFIDMRKLESEEVIKQIDAVKAEILRYVNAKVSASSKLSSVEIMKVPFDKTATLKIRRFLYKENAPIV